MFSKEVMILNKAGVSLRDAGFFIRTASQFQSHIKIRRENRKTASADSILRFICLDLRHGINIIIEANGIDEKEAVETLVGLVKRKFDAAY